jgi:tetratricopeptide (TPR) repeat protein
MIKKLHLIAAAMLFTVAAVAQVTSPPSGDNQKSAVTQYIGLVEVTIRYSSPNVTGPRGEDRKGKIWGNVVHYGFIDQGFGTSKAAPWRAGANENTTISFSHDVVINGNKIAAGTYGLLLDVEKEGPWYWILSKDAGNWGSYFYDAKNDVARVATTPKDCEYTEWLTYSFEDRQSSSTVASLQWENKSASFKIEVPNINEIYVANMRNELQGSITGFTYQGWIEAVQFCVQNKINLEEALLWADNAISGTFVGQENFLTLSTKASVLNALGRKDEAATIMNKAINHPSAAVNDIHQYARTLLNNGQNAQAMEVFQFNAKKNAADKFTPNVGLARGYAALGDKKNAIKHWELAIKNLPDNQKANKAFYEGELNKLKN